MKLCIPALQGDMQAVTREKHVSENTAPELQLNSSHITLQLNLLQIT